MLMGLGSTHTLPPWVGLALGREALPTRKLSYFLTLGAWFFLFLPLCMYMCARMSACY